MAKILISAVFFFVLFSLALTPCRSASEETTIEPEIPNIEVSETSENQEDYTDLQAFPGYYFQAEVLEVLDQTEVTRATGQKETTQKLNLIRLEGDKQGEQFVFDGILKDITTRHTYKKGDKVLVYAGNRIGGGEDYYISDAIRYNSIYLLFLLFALIALYVGRKRGLYSLASLALTFFVIVKVVLPKIIDGGNPLSITIVWASVIVIFSTYLIYGFNKKSSLAVSGTFLGIAIVGALSVIFSNLTKLAGFAAEESVYLNHYIQNFDPRGVMLAGFIFGALGLLGDITITQVSLVQELKEANPQLKRSKLYRQAMQVGVDHIASMVNTLFLAYAGASFFLLLLFSMSEPPLNNFNYIINNEIVATEIVRTLVGSIGIIMAVPITTFLAAHFYTVKLAQKTS